MCYQGNCVGQLVLKNFGSNPCDPNPCQNGGTCRQNSTTGSLFCQCPAGTSYTGN